MIQRSTDAVEAIQDNPQCSRLNLVTEEDWKTLLKNSQISTQSLLDYLELGHHPLADAASERLFPLRVPKPYLDKINKGDPNDPLLLQVLPGSQEQLDVAGYTDDPLEEAEFSPLPGLIHKYRSRVLLITTQSCAIHCRYCFRRNFPYQEHQRSRQDWQEAMSYIESRPEINEVILSGGDPLMLSNESLRQLLQKLDSLPNVKRIRIHSRLVSSLPQRVDRDLLDTLKTLQCRTILVMHCNHPRELGKDVGTATEALRKAGVLLFNQSVLLRNINDDPKILRDLSEALFEHGIQPYYLFTLDKVAGASHFDLSRTEVGRIYQQLLAELPGFLVPKLASENPGESSKTPFNFGHL